MIQKITLKLVPAITPILLFVYVFSGCSASDPERETIDNRTLVEDRKDIERVFSFTLKGGSTFTDSLYWISLNLSDKKDPRIIYYGPEIKTDTTTYYTGKPFQSFSIFSVISADVLYRKSTSNVMSYIGPILGLGILVFIFWANGERNKRK